MPENPLLEMLKLEHPIYEAQKGLWERNERRMAGGDEVLDELRRYEWELEDGADFKARRDSATYVNFGQMYADMVTGHLNRHKPMPDEALMFGTMGLVNRPTGARIPSRAELAFYNTDGIGNDGSEWDNFWMSCVRNAIGTGHRWMFVEAPDVAPTSFEDEILGLRPYLVEFSPLAVTNWHYERGQLAMAVVKTADRAPALGGEGVEGNDYTDNYLLFTRAGFAGLGPQFAGGGWFRFDPEGTLLAEGTWDSTFGAIPMFPLYYQRVKPTATRLAMSRPGATELCNVAVGYMNLSSAADFDAWDAAKSVTWLKGADAEAHNLAAAKMLEGTRLVPLRPVIMGDTVVVPEPMDSGAGAVAASIFTARLEAKREEARELAAREVTTAGDASGVAREAAHTEVKSPRLALVASELEAAQRTAIHFLELRNGATAPEGNVTWTRDFDLLEVRDKVETFFRIQRASGISSRTLTKRAYLAAARNLKLITDDETMAVVDAELEASAVEAEERMAQAGALEAEFGFGSN